MFEGLQVQDILLHVMAVLGLLGLLQYSHKRSLAPIRRDSDHTLSRGGRRAKRTR